ncbi:unnamed protein product, partial [Mesorhabditis belari]|uniref:C-type lectin domain-containing protein n=1 Tax=Mesorhabditis belari TaxID=2138241 RepID=A0AAF3F6F4_9BILA
MRFILLILILALISVGFAGNQTQQELVEARGKICGLETEIQCEQKKRNDEFTKINSKISQSDDRSTKIGAELKEIDSKVAEMSRKIAKLEAELQFERENKTAEIVKLRADLNRTMTWVLDLNGWSYLAKTASWYKVIDQGMTFERAEAYCASRKSHLVSIHRQEENDFVQKLAKTVPSNRLFWIGLERNPNEGNAFQWTDGSSVDFTNWYPGHDSSTHALLGSGGGNWFSLFDTNQLRFICKRSSQF